MNRLRAVLTAAVLTLPLSAAAQNTKVEFDETFDFSKVRTYSIRVGTPWGNELSERRVLAEIDEAIAAKGWTKTGEGQAGIHVLLHGATDTKRSATTFYGGMGGYGYQGFPGGMGSAATTVTEYTVGTLLVDMFDAAAKSLVFRGTAEGELSDNPARNTTKLQKVSARLFKNFPPQPKAK